MSLLSDFCSPENFVWGMIGVLKATITRSRKVENVADGFITGQRKSGCNKFLFGLSISCDA